MQFESDHLLICSHGPPRDVTGEDLYLKRGSQSSRGEGGTWHRASRVLGLRDGEKNLHAPVKGTEEVNLGKQVGR